ncbi:MAG: hypothetical protein JWQ19_2039 [Subtercola sp.]|nr:hypothetical protein [Subtercola sp.]
MTERRTDLPTIEEESQPFWEAAQRGVFLIVRCDSCGKAHHYPRPFCPFCWSENVHWEEASGRATLYTYSVVFMNDLPPFDQNLPYIAAVVDLEEGPRVMTRLLHSSVDDIAIGMPLVAEFAELTDQISAPFFRPAP